MPKGFASLSKAKRREMGAKAGRISQMKGAGHSYNPITARAAAAKAAQNRTAKAVRRAAMYLLECGLTAEQLAKLELSNSEYIFYGGPESTETRLKQLEEMLLNLQ
jgi:ribosomal protein S21